MFSREDFKTGQTIFSEQPAVLCPYDRRLVCFHCCTPLESINEAARRMAKDPKVLFSFRHRVIVVKVEFAQIIPTDKKPEIIQDDITKLRFCCTKCHKDAMDSYFMTFRGKWLQFRNIEDWILRNKVTVRKLNV